MEMHADFSSDLQSRNSYKLDCMNPAVEYDDEPTVDMFDVAVLNCIKHIAITFT